MCVDCALNCVLERRSCAAVGVCVSFAFSRDGYRWATLRLEWRLEGSEYFVAGMTIGGDVRVDGMSCFGRLYL